MIKHLFAFLFGLLPLFLFSSCNKDNNTINPEIFDTKTDVITIDTSTMVFYTFIQDSLITSNTKTALVGSYNDGNLGQVTSSSFFQLALPTSTVIDSTLGTPVYDSISLVMHYSHYYYGDTTKLFTLEAHRLIDRLDTRINYNGYFYNKSNTANLFKPEILGSVRFYPRPSKRDSIEMRLTDDLGLDLFNLMKIHLDPPVQSNPEFMSYFNGIGLMSPANSNSSVLGFNAGNDSIYMVIYYHTSDVVHSSKFMLTNDYYQFNHIESARPVPLNALTRRDNVVLSTANNLNGQSYIQAGVGLMTRIDLPYIRNILNLRSNTDKIIPNIKILKAELILCPIRGTFNLIPLPDNVSKKAADGKNYSIALYQLDNGNNITGAFLNSQGTALSPALETDILENENTQYVFDITSYIANAILLTTPDIPSLGVGISSTDNSNLDRVVFGDGFVERNYNVSKLRILYWRY